MADQFKTMGGRRSRYWCGPGSFRETKKAPVRGFIGQRSAPIFYRGRRRLRPPASITKAKTNRRRKDFQTAIEDNETKGKPNKTHHKPPVIILTCQTTMPARIKTTVVGSYPVLPWMMANPSRPVLRDAVMTVLKTQELAGIDLVTDGELTRFDPSNPEANGMVDYFVSRLSGIRNTFAPTDFEQFRADRASGYRMLTPGVVTGKIGEGTLNLPRDYEFVAGLTKSPLKFTSTGPHMLARMLTNCHYKDVADLAMDLAEVLRRQIELLEAETVQ